MMKKKTSLQEIDIRKIETFKYLESAIQSNGDDAVSVKRRMFMEI